MNKKLLVLIAMMLAAASSAAIAEAPTSTSLDEALLDLEYEDEDIRHFHLKMAYDVIHVYVVD
eukprot:scaffold15685_cov74-Skeletonema_dohrnii-CCMP3373.AAC.1